VRLIADCLLGKAAGKNLGLRMDTLAQLTTGACVRSGGLSFLFLLLLSTNDSTWGVKKSGRG